MTDDPTTDASDDTSADSVDEDSARSVAAIDATWTSVRFVVRVADRVRCGSEALALRDAVHVQRAHFKPDGLRRLAQILPPCRFRNHKRADASILVRIVNRLLVPEVVALLVCDERFEFRAPGSSQWKTRTGGDRRSAGPGRVAFDTVGFHYEGTPDAASPAQP